VTAAAWQPALGAWAIGSETRFRVWAPGHASVELVVEERAGPASRRLEPAGDGFLSGEVGGLAEGTR
jgi:1,4-alpha-glucan branching enzyme